MKTTLLAILGLFISVNLNAQSHRFADSTAEWYMTTYENALWCGGCTSYFTDLYSVQGDTTVNGLPYQKINSALVRRDTSQKVYRYFNDNDVMIYDFARNAGDTFTLLNLYGAGMNVSCRVDSVDTVMLNYPRKRMYITYNDNSFWREQWIEDIGSVSSNFLNPGMELMGFDMPSHSLRCFYEEDSLLLHTDTVDARCDVDTFIPPPPPPHRFFKESSEWYVLYTEWCMMAPCIYFTTYDQHTEGDTIINGLMYQKVRGDNSNYSGVLHSHVRKDSDGKVFMINDREDCEVLIYDFGAEVGDTVVLNYTCGQANVYCRVDSVDSVFMGKPLSVLHVSYRSGGIGNWGIKDTWVEGIGSLSGPAAAPATNYRFTDGGGFTLRCFFQMDTLVYHNTEYNDVCDFDSTWLSINEVKGIAATISPNPSTNNFTLTLNQQPQQNTMLLIHDALGRIAKREELVSATQQVSVADLPNGMYTYMVTQNTVRQASGKLVIAK